MLKFLFLREVVELLGGCAAYPAFDTYKLVCGVALTTPKPFGLNCRCGRCGDRKLWRLPCSAHYTRYTSDDVFVCGLPVASAW